MYALYTFVTGHISWVYVAWLCYLGLAKVRGASNQTAFAYVCLWQWYFVVTAIDNLFGQDPLIFASVVQTAAISFTCTYAALYHYVRWRFFAYYFWFGVSLTTWTAWVIFADWSDGSFRWGVNGIFIFKVLCFTYLTSSMETVTDGRYDDRS